MFKFFKQKNRGFLAVEVLVAVSIITVSVLAMTSVAQQSLSFSRQTLISSQTAFLLEEGGEVVKILRDQGWNNISALSSGVNYYPTFSSSWSLSTTPSVLNGFTRIITFSDVNRDTTTGNIVSSGGVVDPGTRLVNVAVSWSEKGQTSNRSLSFYLMDIY